MQKCDIKELMGISFCETHNEWINPGDCCPQPNNDLKMIGDLTKKYPEGFLLIGMVKSQKTIVACHDPHHHPILGGILLTLKELSNMSSGGSLN